MGAGTGTGDGTTEGSGDGAGDGAGAGAALAGLGLAVDAFTPVLGRRCRSGRDITASDILIEGRILPQHRGRIDSPSVSAGGYRGIRLLRAVWLSKSGSERTV